MLAGIYAGPKAGLRPVHDALMAKIQAFGEFEVAPKKGYVSLRRKKQFAMIGPATNTQVEVGLNMKDVPATARLKAMPAGGMCQYKSVWPKPRKWTPSSSPGSAAPTTAPANPAASINPFPAYPVQALTGFYNVEAGPEAPVFRSMGHPPRVAIRLLRSLLPVAEREEVVADITRRVTPNGAPPAAVLPHACGSGGRRWGRCRPCSDAPGGAG